MKNVWNVALGAALVLGVSACSDDDNNNPDPIINPVSGGTLTSAQASYSFEVNDNEADIIADGEIMVTGNSGTDTQWLITDANRDDLSIIGVADNISDVNFDSAGVGNCYIWSISRNGSVENLSGGNKVASLNGTFDISDNFILVERELGPNSVLGGTLTGGPFQFTVGDKVEDRLADDAISVSGSLGESFAWVVTDDDENDPEIIAIVPSFTAPDFDGAGEGNCLLWYIAWRGDLEGAAAMNNVSDLKGNFALSNPVTVERTQLDIVGLAAGNEDLSILVQALGRFGDTYTNLLMGDGPFTVLAPTNQAFEDLFDALGVENINEVPMDILEQALTLHVIQGTEIKAADLPPSATAVATAGGEITVDGSTTPPSITDANGRVSNVISADFDASNGVVHVIDAVILPQLP